MPIIHHDKCESEYKHQLTFQQTISIMKYLNYFHRPPESDRSHYGFSVGYRSLLRGGGGERGAAHRNFQVMLICKFFVCFTLQTNHPIVAFNNL